MVFTVVFVSVFAPETVLLSRFAGRLTIQQVIHMIFAWSSIISWLLFVCDLGLMAFLSMHAYRDGMVHLRFTNKLIYLKGGVY